MLNTKEQKQLERLLEKQAQTEPALEEKDLEAMEEKILAVYDRSPSLFGDGMSAWRNFCSNLEILADANDRLVREVRRLQKQIMDMESSAEQGIHYERQREED